MFPASIGAKASCFYLCLGLFLLPVLDCANYRASWEQSNQKVLENAASEIGIVDFLKKNLKEGARVTLIPLEHDDVENERIMAALEDQLVQQLLGAGFVVVERDAGLALRMTGETLNAPSLTIVAEPGGFGARKDAGGGWATLKSRMPSVEYFVAYRIAEYGIRYQPGRRSTEREARVHLHVRLLDAAYGTIVAAGTLDAVKADKVPTKLARELGDFHYKPFTHTYPLMPPAPKEMDKPKKEDKRKKRIHFGGGGGTFGGLGGGTVQFGIDGSAGRFDIEGSFYQYKVDDRLFFFLTAFPLEAKHTQKAVGVAYTYFFSPSPLFQWGPGVGISAGLGDEKALIVMPRLTGELNISDFLSLYGNLGAGLNVNTENDFFTHVQDKAYFVGTFGLNLHFGSRNTSGGGDSEIDGQSQ